MKKQNNVFARLNAEIIEKKEYHNIKQSLIRYTAKNNKNDIDKKEVEEMLKAIENVASINGKTVKTIVRAANCQRMFTFKNLNGKLHMAKFDDYYEGTVRNVDKFEKFSEVLVTVVVYNEPQINKEIFSKK